MAPGGIPNYTKLGNGGSYAIPPSPPADHSKVRSSHHTLLEMLSSDQGSSSSSSASTSLSSLVFPAHHFQQVPGNPLLPPPLPAPPSTSLVPVIDQQQMIRQQQQNQFFPMRGGAAAHQQNLILPQQQQQPINKQESAQERVNAILCSPLSNFNDASTGDVKLTIISRDIPGLTVTVHVHTRVLVESSRYFAAKLSYRQQQQQQQQIHGTPFAVEISDCEDVEIYLLTIRLMYSSDFKRTLLQENVPRVLAILKVASAIIFEAGIVASLEYLEAVPWSEDDEEKIFFLVSHMQADYPTVAGAVLSRLVRPTRPSVLALPPPPISPSRKPSDNVDDLSHLQPEEVLIKLMNCVIKATDEKARREMKPLVSRLLRENAAAAKKSSTTPAASLDLSKDSLYDACKECLSELSDAFSRLAAQEPRTNSLLLLAIIGRHVDNLQWLAELLIDRGICDELVQVWARETHLASMHKLLPVTQRHEVSRITARLCVGIGRGQIMVPQDVRASLLATWLQPLMDDFSWMQAKNPGPALVLDRKSVEEGLCHTILTLPLHEQRSILMAWFERFARDGDSCPNLQRAFEVWWRRTFVARV